jgi:restriction system protein
MAKEIVAPSRVLASKVIYAALQILKERGGQAPGKEVIAEVENRLTFNDWERATYEKTGNVRWRAILHLFSIDCIKAGFLIKKKGLWYLTPEGENALASGPIELLKAASAAYRKWRRDNKPDKPEPAEEGAEEEEDNEKNAEADVDQIEQLARDGIRAQIEQKNAYEFQDMVASLLRAMGYYTPFVAPKGKDGGIDIIAYRDPLGTVSPRVKVQIKHREAAASVHEVRQLMGLLQKDGDVGMFVSSGGFTADARSTARSSHVHVELLDLDRFIEMWQEFYPKLVDEDKNRLPLVRIYVYSPQL